jgi:hypothetical protein
MGSGVAPKKKSKGRPRRKNSQLGKKKCEEKKRPRKK